MGDIFFLSKFLVFFDYFDCFVKKYIYLCNQNHDKKELWRN